VGSLGLPQPVKPLRFSLGENLWRGVVRLKKARGYLDDALRAAATSREGKLLPMARLDAIVTEVTEIARETDALIAELRERLERGTD
jgi:hypothetical protein